jgi:hypothetical protein
VELELAAPERFAPERVESERFASLLKHAIRVGANVLIVLLSVLES